MRLAHTADLHGGLTRYGHSTPNGNTRIADFGETFGKIVETAIERSADLLILAGDTFHTRREGPQERELFARHIRAAARHMLVAVLPGNHDGPSTIGDASTHALLWLQSLAVPNVFVLTKPGLHRIGDANVIAIPYPHKRAFEQIERLEHLSPDDRIVEAGVIVEEMIDALRAGPGQPEILVGHFTTVAAKLGSEQTMRMTWDVSVGTHVFDGFDYVALGHIHRQQQVAPNAWYAGSPEYVDFGEEGESKGFLIVDIEPGQPPKVEQVPTNPRGLRTITFSGDETDWPSVVPDGFVEQGQIIRLRFETPTRPRADTIARLRSSAYVDGASVVVLDWKPPAVTASRARVQLDPATDRTEMLRAWLEANGLPIEPTLTAGRELIAARTISA